MRSKKVSYMVLLAILGAWALVLRRIEFPVLPVAPFLKVDFSDLAVLVGLLIKGPLGMGIVILIRDGLNYLMTGGEAGFPIGAVMSMAVSSAFFVPLMSRSKWTQRQLITRLVGSIFSMTIVASALNYWVALPLYMKILNFPIENVANYVTSIIVPFNLIKGSLLAVGIVMIYPILYRQLASRHLLDERYHSSSR